jgi:acetyl esterase/lipase
MSKLNSSLPRVRGTRLRYLLAAFSVVAVSLSSCEEEGGISFPNPRVLIQPKGPAPAYAPNIDPQMLAVLEQFLSYETLPLPTLSPRQARMAPSITDAVQDLLKKNNVPPRPAQVDITQRLLPAGITPQSAPDGILVRIYKPKNAAGQLPVVVYYHGGGWVIGSLDVYEPSAKAISEKSGSIVVSVDYRLSPENKFPAAHEDAYAAYKWVKENAASIGGNPAKVAVAGESAGGNMAVTTALLARDRGLALPTHILSVYPVANNDLNTPSYNQYANAQPLNRPNIQYFVSNYFRTPADGDTPLISLVDVADLRGLPAVTIIAAEIDPLQTEGQQLRDKLLAAGVEVNYQLYQGTTHEFFGTYAVVPVKKMRDQDPQYFEKLAQGQKPQYLFIGCSDSRVPASAITGTGPGEMFVHRNIANMVVHTDMNLLSVLQYAVEVLQVRDIIVCGHYGCGGVAAAAAGKQYGLIDNWLTNIRDVIRLHEMEFLRIKDEEEQLRRLVELNVIEQVRNLAKTNIIQNARKTDNPPRLHGLVYDIREGLLKDLEVNNGMISDLEHIYGTEAMKHAEEVLEEQPGFNPNADKGPQQDAEVADSKNKKESKIEQGKAPLKIA